MKEVVLYQIVVDICKSEKKHKSKFYYSLNCPCCFLALLSMRVTTWTTLLYKFNFMKIVNWKS